MKIRGGRGRGRPLSSFGPTEGYRARQLSKFKKELQKTENTGEGSSWLEASLRTVPCRSIFNVDYLSLSGDNDAKKSIL